jgi:endonuclease V-like protein UPF0215 family
VRAITNVLGIDDGPFPRAHRGDVPVFGCVTSRTRLDGLITTRVRRDGANATRRLVELVRGSPFDGHVQAMLMKGIAVAGFNVVDVVELAERLERPVLVVARKPPDLDAIRRTLLEKVPGGARKWARVERAGPMERCGPLWVQRVGLGPDEAEALLRATTLHGHLPEALRLAHLIAAGAIDGTSRGRA